MRETVLVKLFNPREHDDYFSLYTYDRSHGSNGYFFINKAKMRKYIEANRRVSFPEGYLENDMDYNLQAFWYGEFWIFNITWISRIDHCNIKGHIQYIEIPHSILERALNGETVRFVYDPNSGKARVINKSCNTIREILKDPLIKRAFCKGVRDSFRWRNDITTLYDDSGKSLYFITVGYYNGKMNGGFILHDKMVECEDGINRKAYYYSVHT